jgi:hypothetical protein
VARRGGEAGRKWWETVKEEEEQGEHGVEKQSAKNSKREGVSEKGGDRR